MRVAVVARRTTFNALRDMGLTQPSFHRANQTHPAAISNVINGMSG
jgi:hypothetical protein